MTNKVNFSKTILALALCIVALGARAAAVFDDFESYAVGSNLHGQGGWAGWTNNPNAGALVSTNFSFSPTRSVNITGASDLVHTFIGATSGQWVFSVMQYIPSTSTGDSYVILLNTYRLPYGAADLNWSVQIQCNMDTGQVISDRGGSATLPMAKDKWVELRCEINLAANSVSEFYNGQLLSTHAWQDGTGLNEIQALDLFANNAAPVYYDNVSLAPVTPPVITEQPQSQTNVIGSNVTFSVTATGLPPLSYQWRFNSTSLSGATNTTYTILNAQTNNAGTYDVVVSNPGGSVTSAPAILVCVPPADMTVTATSAGSANGCCCWDFDLVQLHGVPATIVYVEASVPAGVTVCSVSGPGTETPTWNSATRLIRWNIPGGLICDNGPATTVHACFSGIGTAGTVLTFTGYNIWDQCATYYYSCPKMVTIGANGECPFGGCSPGKVVYEDYTGSYPYRGIYTVELSGANPQLVVRLNNPQTGYSDAAINPLTGKMYWGDNSTSPSTLMESDINGSIQSQRLVTTTAGIVHHIAVDPVGSGVPMVYWDDGYTTIYRCRIAPGGPLPTPTITAPSLHGFALDLRSTGNLYYYDGAYVWRANLDGTGLFQLPNQIGNGTTWPGGFALDTCQDKIYVVGIEGNPHVPYIRCANLIDASGLVTIQSGGAALGYQPEHIALDLHNRTMYWTGNDIGSGLAQVRSASMDVPNGPTTPVVTGSGSPGPSFKGIALCLPDNECPSGRTGCVPPPGNLALWLPFDEASGPTAVNLASGGNNGTEINGPAVVNGHVLRSLCFDGVSQSVSVPDYPAINPGANEDFTIDAWVKRSINSGNGVRIIVDKRDPTTGIGYSLAVYSGNLILQLADASGYTNYRDTGTVPADDQWHFVAVTVSRSQTAGGRFYIDGSPSPTTFDPTGHAGSLNNTAPFQVADSPLGGNAPWLGCLDEVELFKRALLPQEILGIYLAGSAGKCKCVPPPANMSAWWPFDEATGTTANDSAGAVDNVGAHNGGLTPAVGMVGNALCFDGKTAFVEVPDDPEVNFIGSCANGAESFTIDAWIRPAINGPDLQTLLDKRVNPSAPIGYDLYLFNGHLGFQIADGTAQNYNSPSPDLRDGQWHFIAVTVARCGPNGNVITFSVDGSVFPGFSDPRTGDLNNTTALQIGRREPLFGANYYAGCIDELEIFKRALTPQEILGIFKAGSAGKCNCVPPPANMSAWWPLNEATGTTANDIAGAVDNVGAHNGGLTPVAGMVGNALCFDGTTAFVEVLDDPEVNFVGSCASGAESFTIDAWIRPTANGPSLQTLLDKRANPSAPIGYNLYLFNGHLGFQIADGTAQNYNSPSPDLRDGQWHFIAVTVARCGPNGNVITFSVDGSVFPSFSDPRTGDLNNTATLQIGRREPLFGANYYTGCMDELEIFKRALVPQEIQGIFAAGSAGKCKPGGLPGITQQPQNRATVPGSNVTFSVTATGTLPMAYQWYFNTTNIISGATNTTYTILNAQTNNTGTYGVVISNVFGAVTSAPAMLMLLPPANLLVTATYTGPESGCCCWDFDLVQQNGVPNEVAYVEASVPSGVAVCSVSGPGTATWDSNTRLIRWYIPGYLSPYSGPATTVHACFSYGQAGTTLTFNGYMDETVPYPGNILNPFYSPPKMVTIVGSAQCACQGCQPDLWMKDTMLAFGAPEDPGVEPNVTGAPMWISPDIWVRTYQDQLTGSPNPGSDPDSTGGIIYSNEHQHQNPLYAGNWQNHVYVKIRNRGSFMSSGNEVLRVYWAAASTGLPWDNNPTLNATIWTEITAPAGLPLLLPIMPGDAYVADLPWAPPNPTQYWPYDGHFCMVARIETSSSYPFGMTFPEGTDIYINTMNNNNIVWKNMTVLSDIITDGDRVIVRNTAIQAQPLTLQFSVPRAEITNHFLLHGDIFVDLGSALLKKWQQGGQAAVGFVVVSNSTQIRITDPTNAVLAGMLFDAGEAQAINVKFQRWPTELLPAGQVFNWDITQIAPLASNAPPRVIGGERYMYVAQGNTLHWSASGGKLSLSWVGGGVLQQTATLAGPWTDMPTAVSPYSPALTARQQFYRVVFH